ncbi:hypothetical protein [Streptomyces sp. SD15]
MMSADGPDESWLALGTTLCAKVRERYAELSRRFPADAEKEPPCSPAPGKGDR